MRIVLVVLLGIASLALAQSKDGTKPPQKSENACSNPCCNQPCSAPITITVSPTQTLHADAQKQPGEEHSKSEWEKGTALGTIALAAFTLLVLVVAIRQRYDLKDSAERQLRAYVGITYPELIHVPEEGKLLAIVKYANTGQSPAHDVELRMAARIFDHAYPPPWEPPGTNEDEGKGGVMVPTVEWDRNLPVLPLEGTSYDDLLTSIVRQKKRIWVWGTITYRDIFERENIVKFRFKSGKDTKSSPIHKDRHYFALIPDLTHSKASYGKKPQKQ